MKRLFSYTILFLLLASPGWAADKIVFVSASGSATSPYDTWAKAAHTESVAQTYLDGQAVGTGHKIYIGAGTYSADYLYLTNANSANETVFGVSAAGVTARCGEGGAYPTDCTAYSAVRGEVNLSRTTGNLINCSQTGQTIKNISAYNGGGTYTAFQVSGANFIGDNLDISDSTYTAYMSGTGFNITRSWFRGGVGNNPVNIFTAGAGTFSYCFFGQSTTNLASTGAGYTTVKSSSSGDVYFNNCIFVGHDATAVQKSSGAGKIYLRNSYIGPPRREGEYPLLDTGTADFNITNNIISVTTDGGTHYQLGGSGIAHFVDTNNIKTLSTLFAHHQRTGYIIPEVDGTQASGTYPGRLASALKARGMKGTWYITGVDLQNSTYKGYAQSYVSDPTLGLSIGVHTYSHNYLDNTGNLFGGTGIATCTSVNINRTANTITVVGTPGGTISNFKTTAISSIRTQLVSAGCTVGTMILQNENALGEWIADSAGAQNIPYNPQILAGDNTQGMLKAETTDAKAYAESQLTGYTAKSFATPGGNYNAASNTAILTAGFLGNRNYLAAANLWTGLSEDLRSIDLFNGTFRLATTDLIGASDAETTRNAHAYADRAASFGLIIHALIYDASDVSDANLALILDAWAQHPDVVVSSADDAYAAIRNSPWTDDSSNHSGVTGRYYVRTWADQSDFHLQATSPAIYAGTNLSMTTDFDGYPVMNPPSIGAYEPWSWKRRIF